MNPEQSWTFALLPHSSKTVWRRAIQCLRWGRTGRCVGVSAMGYLSEARVRLIIAIWLILVGLLPISVVAEESTDAALQFYAVQVLHTSEQSPAGAGIYLGKGLVITAAHVTGS